MLDSTLLRARRQRISHALAANTFGQAVTICIQLLSLPLFLYVWDATKYGNWLLLSAIPAYLILADVGIGSAAGNELTIALARREVEQANSVLHTATAILIILCVAVVGLLIPFILLESAILKAEHRWAMALLIVSVLATLVSGLAEGVFRATGRYALGTMIANFIRLGEFGGYMAGLFLQGDFFSVAAGGECS